MYSGKVITFGLLTMILIVSLACITLNKLERIEELQDRIQVLEIQLDVAHTSIKQCQTAMNFEKLFLLVAKPDSIALLGDLENYIRDKADFCLNKTGLHDSDAYPKE